MSFLVDTDVCSAHLRGFRGVSGRFLQHTGTLHISAVSLGELYTWLLRRGSSRKYLEGLSDLLSDVTVLKVDHYVAREYGEVRSRLLDQGCPMPGMELLVAATALVHGLTLVTHNTRHFANVSGLNMVDWLAP